MEVIVIFRSFVSIKLTQHVLVYSFYLFKVTEMANVNFWYNGIKFSPIRSFSNKEQKVGLKLPLTSVGISCWNDTAANKKLADFDYDAFYNEAKLVGAENFDIFTIEDVKFTTTMKYKRFHDLFGKPLVPCGYELFLLMLD